MSFFQNIAVIFISTPISLQFLIPSFLDTPGPLGAGLSAWFTLLLLQFFMEAGIILCIPSK